MGQNLEKNVAERKKLKLVQKGEQNGTLEYSIYLLSPELEPELDSDSKFWIKININYETFIWEKILCRGVRDRKLKETLDSASRMAMRGEKKNKQTDITLMDTVDRERVSEINWVT